MKQNIVVYSDDSIELELFKGEGPAVLTVTFDGAEGVESVVSRPITPGELHRIGTRLMLIAADQEALLKP